MNNFVEGEPGLFASFLLWILEAVYDWYYRHWGHKSWTFGDKWNAMIERLDFEIEMKRIELNWAKGLRGDGND